MKCKHYIPGFLVLLALSFLMCMYLLFKTQWKLKKNVSFIKNSVAIFSEVVRKNLANLVLYLVLQTINTQILQSRVFREDHQHTESGLKTSLFL